MGCFGGEDSEPEDEFDRLPRSLKWRLAVGSKKTEVSESSTIIRLGNKRILKKGVESTEYEALRLVNEKTSVPVPKVLGVYNTREGVLVDLEVVQGKTLDVMWSTFSESQRKKIVGDLGRFVDQLRKLQAPKHVVIASTLYGACHDRRFGKGRIGPFYTLDQFHHYVRRGHPLDDFNDKSLQVCHTKNYEVRFTHADLCPQNILVDENGRVSAVLDWENAGWYPEYWEYTQMHFAIPKGMEDWLEMMKMVLKRYDQEVAAEATVRSRYASSDYDRPLSVRAPSPTPSELRRELKETDDKNTENTSG